MAPPLSAVFKYWIELRNGKPSLNLASVRTLEFIVLLTAISSKSPRMKMANDFFHLYPNTPEF